MRARTPRRQSASLAVFLSFLWPGLGQWYLGRRRAAAALASLALLGTLVLVFPLRDGLTAMAARLFVPSVAVAVLIAIVMLALLRLFAMTDAWRRGAPLRRERAPATVVLALLVTAIVVSHGATGYLVLAFYDAGSRIFVGSTQTDLPITSSPTPSMGQLPPTLVPADDFHATPDATPPSKQARLTVLLTGIDSGADRDHALTDTLLVVSVDPETRQVAMVSFPRDIAGFELYDGRTFRNRINTLMTSARVSPDLYPDGPLPTLTRELGYLVGVPINYFAAVNLDGFRTMVELMGGVDVVNPRAINDPAYDWLNGRHGFYLKAGPVHLSSQTALAFVRSRQGEGDSDFTRAARQQLLLLALRTKVSDPAMLPKVPALLDAASRTVKTNFPVERLEEMLALAGSIDQGSIQQFVLGPPYSYHPPTTTTGGQWELRLDMAKVGALSVDLFGEDSRYYPGPTAGP